MAPRKLPHLLAKVCLSFSFMKYINQFVIKSATFVILRITTCYNTKEQRLEVEGNLKKWKKQRKKWRHETVVFSLENKTKENKTKTLFFPSLLAFLKTYFKTRFGKIYTCLNLGSVLLYSAFLYHTLLIHISFRRKCMWQADARLTL